MASRARTLVALASLCAALALSACGDGEDSSTSSGAAGTAPAVTLAQFQVQADAICEQANARRAAAGQHPNFDPQRATPAELKDAVGFLSVNLDVAKAEAGKLAALGLPEGHETEVQNLLGTLQGRTVAEFSDAVEAARNGDKATFLQGLTKVEQASRKANALADQLGLEVCGK